MERLQPRRKYVLLKRIRMATQNISLTIVSVTLSEIKSLRIIRDADNPGSVVLEAEYDVKDDGGGLFKNTQITVPLSAAEKTTLVNFITNNVLPAINTAEGF